MNMSEQFVALYTDQFSDTVAVGPFDTQAAAERYLDDLVDEGKLREKNTLGAAKLVKP
jgi:hypothetical protein